MNRLPITLFFFTLVFALPLLPEQSIILTLKYSEVIPEQRPTIGSVIDKQVKTPKSKLKKDLSGYLAILDGYASISNYDGQIMFPRSSITDSLNILLSDSVSPVIYHGNTVDHMNIRSPESSTLYKATRNHDADSDTYSWNIEKIDLPTDLIVPANTILIFGQPSGIKLPIGNYKTVGDPHLLLPIIFVSPSAQTPRNYIHYLKHSRLNKLIKKVYVEGETTLSVAIEE